MTWAIIDVIFDILCGAGLIVIAILIYSYLKRRNHPEVTKNLKVQLYLTAIVSFISGILFIVKHFF